MCWGFEVTRHVDTQITCFISALQFRSAGKILTVFPSLLENSSWHLSALRGVSQGRQSCHSTKDLEHLASVASASNFYITHNDIANFFKSFTYVRTTASSKQNSGHTVWCLCLIWSHQLEHGRFSRNKILLSNFISWRCSQSTSVFPVRHDGWWCRML